MAERYNRIIKNKVRAMLMWSQLPNEFRGFAATTANYFKNCCVTKPEQEIPFETWYWRDVTHKNIFEHGVGINLNLKPDQIQNMIQDQRKRY